MIRYNTIYYIIVQDKYGEISDEESSTSEEEDEEAAVYNKGNESNDYVFFFQYLIFKKTIHIVMIGLIVIMLTCN